MLTTDEQLQLELIIKKMVTLPDGKCKVSFVFALDTEHKLGFYPDITVLQKGACIKM